MNQFIEMIVPMLSGLSFGIAIQKGHVYEPSVIYNQMQFQSWGMMKMFLAAVGTSQLVLAFIDAYKPKLLPEICASKDKNSRGLVSVALGGGLLGSGMALAGACPGTVLVQIGTGVDNAIITFLGGIAGTLIFAMIEKPFNTHISPMLRLKVHYLNEYFNISYQKFAIGMATLLFTGISILEYLVPWKSELVGLFPYDSTSFPFITSVAWSPYFAGAVVGSLQLPLVLGLKDSLGSSTAYSSFVARFINPISESMVNSCDCLRTSKTSWQFWYVLCAIFGGYLSISMGRALPVQGMPATRAFIGGLFTILGSRMANGCTSGHGISGMGFLRIRSFVAVASMFLGGFITTLIAPL